MNGGRSWSWDGYLKRRSIFFTTVATAREYDLAFMSTNPRGTRYILPNLPETTKVRIGVFYSNPQRLIVKWNKRYMRDLNPSGYDFRSVVRPTAEHPCGSNAYIGWSVQRANAGPCKVSAFSPSSHALPLL